MFGRRFAGSKARWRYAGLALLLPLALSATRCGGKTEQNAAATGGARAPIYVLVERSAFMNEPWGNSTRWQFVTEALSVLTPALYPLSSVAFALSGAPDWDCCAGLHCGERDRAGVCVS